MSWMPAPSGQVDGTHLCLVCEELRKSGQESIGGVPLARLTEILEVGERGRDGAGEEMFVPLFVSTQGARTFLPVDPTEAEEAPLRKLADECEDPIVGTRIYEVLLARFPTRRRDLQVEIIKARLASLSLISDWPTLLDNVVRATLLAGSAKDEQQLRAVLEGWELVGTKVLAAEYWWAFGVVAHVFASRVLRAKWRKLVDAARVERWNITVRWLAESTSSLGHFHRQEVFDDVATWCGLIGDAAGKLTYHRRQIEDILTEAREVGGLVATAHLSRAMKLAGDRGGQFKDLLLEAKRAFPIEAERAEAEFKPHQIGMQLPQSVIDGLEEILQRSSDAPSAFQSLAVLPLLMQVSLDELRVSARKSMEGFIAWRMMPTISHRDGKVSSISATEEDKVRDQVAFMLQIRLGMSEVVLRNALTRLFERLSPSDLSSLLVQCRWLDRARVPFLQRASERFQAQDWISAGVLTSTMYEAVLRDFIRWTGYPARAVTPDGLHADQTLGDMLASTEVRRVLGDDHIAMITYVLGDPQRGMNLRNDVAHGTAHAPALSPERILLIWLFMIRLALMRPLDEDQNDVGSAPASGGAPEPDDEGEAEVPSTAE